MFDIADLPDTDVQLAPRWMPAVEADALFEALRADVPWARHRLRIFGREVEAPRLSCWIGDPDAMYRYSGARFTPEPWPAALVPVRDAVSAAAGVRFNSVLANLYRDGQDAMGWHSDDERELGSEPVIVSLSLGATRRFVLKGRVADADGRFARHVLELPHGSLLVMRGETQARFRHALPRTARPVGPRINLTFRKILC
ncbi:alpha-ketoglutarate-dependent dioxygenase AlkB [Luteimonas fraxinea]|uniref:Alpha-ketoglutarate-dependent dioxygenase AlkB n=2 Tax=Luteimonas fraxinea TaxID=2901869 RepID=A0ABS8UIN4_9GAMM|nr:alpha-ketoglutarate-dependent dioxygenase AlkB [Luteimonas fraxinea]MCD9098576.1 alpha-ketoglutarate-dependent dioxygenase AlkB [Luteimonas fraxinea]MCD9127309.1 alpha-ketoglutarate-dependent dioxygenase AlkB [Luteimonas fraxinea]UHH09020.1 alpha-ketoglutarate-dependent dioxygenase AlkB [Luteimonas fraxinea]